MMKVMIQMTIITIQMLVDLIHMVKVMIQMLVDLIHMVKVMIRMTIITIQMLVDLIHMVKVMIQMLVDLMSTNREDLVYMGGADKEDGGGVANKNWNSAVAVDKNWNSAAEKGSFNRHNRYTGYPQRCKDGSSKKFHRNTNMNC
jgi:hypothetical protein